jgi:hypothetical protein
MKPQLEFQVTTQGCWSMFFSELFDLMLLIIVPLLLHAYLSPHPEDGNSPDQAAHYYILSILSVCLLDPALGWLQSKDISFFLACPRNIFQDFVKITWQKHKLLRAIINSGNHV